MARALLVQAWSPVVNLLSLVWVNNLSYYIDIYIYIYIYMGFRVSWFRVKLSPYNAESNGKEHGKLNGNWGNLIGDSRNLI